MGYSGSPFQSIVVWALMQFLDIVLVSACDMQSCTGNFVSRTQSVEARPHHTYCVPLQDYMKCIEDQKKACHGNMMFHGNIISVQTLLKEKRCYEILAKGDFPKGDAHSSPPTVDPFLKNDPCWHKGTPSNPAHCGLFGDPHLKTFNGTFMTCRVKGAWPMLSSSHMAIQVTNEAVSSDFYKATATTKVTVLIKSNSSCGAAKTYEASRDSLPKAFVDGTTFSGLNKIRPFADVVESRSGHHVLINVRSINAVVSIRKVGSYLSVSVTLPEEVVQELNDDLQLCLGGCPRTEQLTESSVIKPRRSIMSEEKALSLCLEHNITDYYLDSCVFDLVTTGDLTFREAAALSLKDMWAEDPKTSSSILKNCSSWPCEWKVTSYQGKLQSSPQVLFAVVVLGCLLTLASSLECGLNSKTRNQNTVYLVIR